MRTINCDAVLFDLDGVLIDSKVCVERHWKEWAVKHQLDAGEIVSQAHGVRSIEIIRRFAPHLDAGVEADLYSANEVTDTVGVVPVEGARELMETLPAECWAIVTSCNEALARARLEAAGLPVPEKMITSDDVVQGKPDPEPYLAGVRLLGISPEASVVIEDAPAGVQAGVNAGMRVVGIQGSRDGDELRDAGADIVVQQLTDLVFKRSEEGYRLEILFRQESE
jgi:sugar-phosphatase